MSTRSSPNNLNLAADQEKLRSGYPEEEAEKGWHQGQVEPNSYGDATSNGYEGLIGKWNAKSAARASTMDGAWLWRQREIDDDGGIHFDGFAIQ
jgi:hypothetical protein